MVFTELVETIFVCILTKNRTQTKHEKSIHFRHLQYV